MDEIMTTALKERKFRDLHPRIGSGTLVSIMMVVLGLISLFGSAFYGSYVLAFIGLGLTFWGALLLYLKPTKHVSLELLTASASSSLVNIEKTLLAAASSAPDQKGIYLPPKHMKNYESSLVFIPSRPSIVLPSPEEADEQNLYSTNPSGMLITPPGLALSRLLEQKLGRPFTDLDISSLQRELPKLFDRFDITKNMVIHNEARTVTVEMTNHIFKNLCEETRKLKKTHDTVGCPLSSAIACALAKATGKPITIQNEEQPNEKTTKITYTILEE